MNRGDPDQLKTFDTIALVFRSRFPIFANVFYPVCIDWIFIKIAKINFYYFLIFIVVNSTHG